MLVIINKITTLTDNLIANFGDDAEYCHTRAVTSRHGIIMRSVKRYINKPISQSTSQQLDSTYKDKLSKLKLIKEQMKGIDELEISIKVHQDTDGLTSPIVMGLFDDLHTKRMGCINALIDLSK